MQIHQGMHNACVQNEVSPCIYRLLLKASNGVVTNNSFIKPKFIAAQVCSPLMCCYGFCNVS